MMSEENSLLAKILARRAASHVESLQQLDDSGRFPYPYATDLHWFWGWGKAIEDRLARDDGINEFEPWVFRPTKQANEAMMRFSISYPAIIKRIQDGLDFVELMFREWGATQGESDNVMRALDSLRGRIMTAAETIAKAEAKRASDELAQSRSNSAETSTDTRKDSTNWALMSPSDLETLTGYGAVKVKALLADQVIPNVFISTKMYKIDPSFIENTRSMRLKLK